MSEYFVIILIWIFFVAIALYIRHNSTSWLEPSPFFVLLWLFLIGFSIFLAPYNYYSGYAIILIICLLITFVIGGQSSRFLNREKFLNHIAITPDNFQTYIKPLFLLSCAGILSGLAACLYFIYYQHISILSIFSVKNYIETAAKMSLLRYQGEELPSSINLLLTFNFIGIHGTAILIFLLKKKKIKWLLLMILLPPLFLTLLTTARTIMLFSFISFISTLLVTQLFFNGKFKLFSRINIILGSSIFIGIVLMFIITQISRMDLNYSSKDNFKKVIYHLNPWFFGNVSGFSVWYDRNPSLNEFAGGNYTFGGMVEMLSDYHRKLGMYDQYTIINDGGQKTNIFTFFRGIIEDFSVYGAFIFIFIFGYMAEFLLGWLKQGKIFLIPLLAAVFGEMIWSPIVSLLYYNSLLFSYIFFFSFLFILSLKSKVQ